MNELKLMQNVLELEAQSLLRAKDRLNAESVVGLLQIFEHLTRENGSLIFCGVGKSGVVAKKLSSTFASLGLHSYFLHPTEALHGDLGRVRSTDAIVFISKSGTTEEIIKLLPFISIPEDRRIGLIGSLSNPIADVCKVVLDVSVEKEACLNNQAPTTSSTLAMAMGDAMAVLWESYIGLSKENFAVNHPGGILGKSLRIKVKDLIIPKDQCPILSETAKLQDVILEMTKFPVGGAAVLAPDGKLLGIVVEGDIRRTFTKSANNGLDTLVKDIMNLQPISISEDQLAFEALELMENGKRQIQILPVLKDKTFVGFLRLHDLLKEGFNKSR